jgi:hypothetical protein
MESDVEEGVARSTRVFWANLLKEVIDGYEQMTSIVHGVQKDAIQNGWDARTDSEGEGWSFKFELIEGSQNTFLCMTDSGTYGLTGEVLPDDEYANGLSKHQRWAAFEGYGFTKEDFEKNPMLGSRGRGKFIFVGASSRSQILYDTLTIDGNYRFGSRLIDRTRNDIIHFNGDKGRKRLQEATLGAISALKQVGTRVIITEPIPELIESFKSSEFEFMIGETWWEIIKKNRAQISIIYEGKERIVQVPTAYDLLKKDNGKKKVWLKRGQKIQFGDVTTEVRALHIVCLPGEEIPEELRGISIQRGGMKICTEQIWSLPPHIRNSMYGYLSLDEAGEQAIKEAEGVEHNTLKKRRTFVRDLRFWLSHEMIDFAKAKLGYREHPERELREKQKSAENSALSAINQIAKTMNLKRVGPAMREHIGTIRGSQKPIRLQIPQPEYPNPQSRRVDYNQSIHSIRISVANDTKQDAEIKLKIYLRYEKEHFEDLSETTHIVPKEGQEVCFSLDDFKIQENHFPKKGQYVFTARITEIESASKLDQKGFTFFVETEPLARGIFEAFRPYSLEEGEYQYAIGYVNTSDSGGLVLNYNVLHPGYLAVEDEKEAITEYLFRFAAMELVKIDFGSPNPKIVQLDANQQNDFDYVLERYNLAMGKLFYYFYRSSS